MPSPSDVPRRRNGMSSPYSMPQIASWVFLGSTALHFILFITPILPLGPSVSLTIVFFVLIGLVIYYGIRAIAVDSMDIYLKKSLVEQRNGEIKHESNFLNKLYEKFNGTADTIKDEKPPDDEERKQCWLCDVQVAEHSMHCKYCNKCVSHFDHHCLWLNTCIGEKNYDDFYKVMWSISAMQVVHMCISAGLVIDIFIKGPTKERADEWFGAPACSALLLLFIVFDICSLVLLAQLIAFHIHLKKEQITTYQFIVRDSKKRREKSKLLQDLHLQRLSELQRAKQEGNQWYTFRLKCGDKCRESGCGILDPLDMPEPPPPPDRNAGFGAALGGAPTIKTTGDNDDDENDFERNGDDDNASADAMMNGTPMNGHGDEDDEADASQESENGVTFLPVAIVGMSNERHDLDSLASQSEAEQVSYMEEADSSLMMEGDDDHSAANGDDDNMILLEKQDLDNSLAVQSETSDVAPLGGIDSQGDQNIESQGDDTIEPQGDSNDEPQGDDDDEPQDSESQVGIEVNVEDVETQGTDSHEDEPKPK